MVGGGAAAGLRGKFVSLNELWCFVLGDVYANEFKFCGGKCSFVRDRSNIEFTKVVLGIKFIL